MGRGRRQDCASYWQTKLFKAAEWAGVEGKAVLVIGTQQPWVEAVLFTK